MAKLPNFLVIIRSEKLSGKGQGRGVGVRKKERFVLGKRTFRSQKSKHFVLRIIILSVPFGLMGSFLFAKLFGLENNIYLQTGVIMLIGLLAKTAILITEYAIERRRKGMGIVESAYSAAQVRLRPILMTVLTMIFGMLPLMFSTGAGANGNSSLGTGVVGGMAVGTLALLFVVPVFYIIFEFLQEKIRKPMEEEPDAQVLLEKERSHAEQSTFGNEKKK